MKTKAPRKRMTKAQLARFRREVLPRLGAAARVLTPEHRKAISQRGALAFTVRARLRALERSTTRTRETEPGR